GPAEQRRAQTPARPAQPEAAGGAAPARPDGQGEGGVRVQAPLPDRQAAGELPRQGPGPPQPDVRVPARAAGAAAVLPGGVPAVRRLSGGAAGAGAGGAAAEGEGGLGGPGGGEGLGDVGEGQVRQDDSLPGEAGAPAGQDQQPCGAGQPAVAVRREGAGQVAVGAVTGPLPAPPPGAAGRAAGTPDTPIRP